MRLSFHFFIHSFIHSFVAASPLSDFLTTDHNCLVLEVVALLNVVFLLSTISWLNFLPRAEAFSNL